MNRTVVLQTAKRTPPNNICSKNYDTCGRSYVGQTSRSLNVRFQEHVRYIRNNNPQSAYAQHILQNQHEYGQMNSILTHLKPLNNPMLTVLLASNVTLQASSTGHRNVYVWLPHLLTPVGLTKEVGVISLMISAVRCRWCMFHSCAWKLQMGGI